MSVSRHVRKGSEGGLVCGRPRGTSATFPAAPRLHNLVTVDELQSHVKEIKLEGSSLGSEQLVGSERAFILDALSAVNSLLRNPKWTKEWRERVEKVVGAIDSSGRFQFCCLFRPKMDPIIVGRRICELTIFVMVQDPPPHPDHDTSSDRLQDLTIGFQSVSFEGHSAPHTPRLGNHTSGHIHNPNMAKISEPQLVIRTESGGILADALAETLIHISSSSGPLLVENLPNKEVLPPRPQKLRRCSPELTEFQHLLTSQSSVGVCDIHPLRLSQSETSLPPPIKPPPKLHHTHQADSTLARNHPHVPVAPTALSHSPRGSVSPTTSPPKRPLPPTPPPLPPAPPPVPPRTSRSESLPTLSHIKSSSIDSGGGFPVARHSCDGIFPGANQNGVGRASGNLIGAEDGPSTSLIRLLMAENKPPQETPFFLPLDANLSSKGRREAVEATMQGYGEGCWLLRYNTREKAFVLSIRYKGEVRHLFIASTPEGHLLGGRSFPDMYALLLHYSRAPINDPANGLMCPLGKHVPCHYDSQGYVVI